MNLHIYWVSVMAKLYEIHPTNPQTRSIEEIVKKLRGGAVAVYPTDTSYAIGCDLQSKSAIERVKQIKQFANNKPLTFLCSSLSDIATYAIVRDEAYRLMKQFVPGPYTFILPATKLVPKIIQDPKRKSTGIRVPDHSICQALMAELGNPLISTSAHLKMEDEDLDGDEELFVELDKARLFDSLDKLVDILIDDGSAATNSISTVLDVSEHSPTLLRQGMGWAEISSWVE
jgi:tRNA threonylcarbamoyl adenosine modification protein (Sua5/YciO/YrdC/YwlC family)